jgi:hypothetical protein
MSEKVWFITGTSRGFGRAGRAAVPAGPAQEVAPFGIHVTPLRVFFGESPLQTARTDYESRLATWEQWQPVVVEAQGWLHSVRVGLQ